LSDRRLRLLKPPKNAFTPDATRVADRKPTRSRRKETITDRIRAVCIMHTAALHTYSNGLEQIEGANSRRDSQLRGIMPRIHRVPFGAGLSETAMANLRLMAGQARVRPATMGAELLEGLLAVPTAPGSSPMMSPASLKEILFRAVYATHLLEIAMQKNRTAIRS